jgi:hypothetical protein
MKRYAVSKIIGDGTEENMYRPTIANYPNISYSIAIAPDQVQNESRRWVLALVIGEAAALAAADASPDVVVLPFGPEQNGSPWISMGTQQQRQVAVSAVQANTGYQINRDDPRTVGAVMTDLGRAVDANFNAETFATVVE